MLNTFGFNHCKIKYYFWALFYGSVMPITFLCIIKPDLVFDITNIKVGLFLWQIFSIVILPMFLEEILFRGLLWKVIERRAIGEYVPSIITAIIFVIAHMDFRHMLGVIPLTLFITRLRFESNSLYPGIIAHGLNNLIIVLVMNLFNLK